MNNIDFTQTGGFPLDQDVLKFMQDAVLMAAQTASLGGPLAIVSGCDIIGNNAADGYVSIAGELLPFKGGVVQAKVIITETVTNLTYADGTAKPVQKVRVATFGDDGVQNNEWAKFKRNTNEGVLARIDRLEFLLKPFFLGGSMLFWNKPFADIPAGWREAADWRGRMPRHFNPDDPTAARPGMFGGSDMHTNTIEEMAPHGHGYDTPHGNGSASGNGVNHPDGPLEHHQTDSVGGGQAYSIMNPYRIVIFIEPIPGSF